MVNATHVLPAFVNNCPHANQQQTTAKAIYIMQKKEREKRATEPNKESKGQA